MIRIFFGVLSIWAVAVCGATGASWAAEPESAVRDRAAGRTTVAADQEGYPKRSVIRWGEYYDLTLLRASKLGAAPFVNPALLKSMAIAYKYDVPAVAAVARWEDIRPLLKSGVVGFAKATGNTYEIISVHGRMDSMWRMKGKRLMEATGKIEEQVLVDLLGSKVVFVSGAKKLLGAEPAGKIVSWEAGDPVTGLAY